MFGARPKDLLKPRPASKLEHCGKFRVRVARSSDHESICCGLFDYLPQSAEPLMHNATESFPTHVCPLSEGSTAEDYGGEKRDYRFSLAPNAEERKRNS
jgi:hypothetical protein